MVPPKRHLKGAASRATLARHLRCGFHGARRLRQTGTSAHRLQTGRLECCAVRDRAPFAFDNPAWPTLIFSFGPPCVSHLYSVCHDLFSVLFPVRGVRGGSPPRRSARSIRQRSPVGALVKGPAQAEGLGSRFHYMSSISYSID